MMNRRFGLFFAEFGVYIIDSLIAIFIARMILWKGIEALRELLDVGDDISIDTIHLAASKRYDDKITDWALAQLARGPMSLSDSNEAFLHGVRIVMRYFDIHAIIGFSNLEERGYIGAFTTKIALLSLRRSLNSSPKYLRVGTALLWALLFGSSYSSS